MSDLERTQGIEELSSVSEGRSEGESNPQSQVLVPLDGSALAEAVLPHALSFARITASGLVLLRVAHTPYIPWLEFAGATGQVDADLFEDVWKVELDEAHSYLADVAQRLQPLGLPVQVEVLQGAPAQAIVGYIEQHPHVRLTVMATHGRSGLRGWVLGSVAEKVLHASPKPLLLVRPAASEAGMQVQARPAPAQIYRAILVPLDGSQFAEQALEQARELATLTGAALVLVSVLLGSEDYMSEAVATEPWAIADRKEAERLRAYLAATAEQLQGAGLVVLTQLIHGYPPEEILKVGEQTQADMIVMATHGRGGLQRLWLGSVALKVVQASSLPVLLVRPSEARNEADGQRRPGAWLAASLSLWAAISLLP